MADVVIVADRLVNTDTFTSAGIGTTFDCSATPLKDFTIQVVGNTVPALLWTVLLEGSVDDENFTTILTHMTVAGDAVFISSGSSHTPVLYIRTHVVALTLGSATNIEVTIVGV